VTIAKARTSQFAEVLPDHIDAKQFVGSALAALRKDPDLLAAAENSPTAFVNSLMHAAQLGHVPGSKEYYLTRRRDKNTGGREIIVGLEGYRGVIERMYRSGAVASVIVREVCAGDRFEFVEGVMDKPVHEVDWFNPGGRGDIIGVYAYAHLTTGAVSRVVVLNRKDIDDAKSRSDAGKKDVGPWKTDYRAMVWKTAAHRLEPWVPTSAEFRREQLRAAVAADNLRAPAGVDPTTGEVFDVVDAEVIEGENQ
jgi:recombination protein RecT